ncbi:MAG: hypothetical protein LLG42_00930 [Chloroflexi bacterium]|nr:hypothetical protein [Chloroflexota bacterium]
MNAAIVYIALSIVSLAVIAILEFFVWKNRKEKRLSPFAGLAFGFVLAGLFAGEDRPAGYGLMGIGVLLALLDMWKKRSKIDKPE